MRINSTQYKLVRICVRSQVTSQALKLKGFPLVHRHAGQTREFPRCERVNSLGVELATGLGPHQLAAITAEY